MPEPVGYSVIVHGGCKPIKPSQAEANRRGMRNALETAVRVLQGNGSAVDAVEAAIRVLEDDPTFNAGNGSVPNEDGEIEMDAALMDGETLALGGVCAAKDLPHPISVARAMLPEVETLLAGDGALRFAQEHGVVDGASRVAAGAGPGTTTVGCVALDVAGRIAAGTSTGGLEDCHVGRVGDSALPGCGIYADNQAGGVSASGEGESISRSLLAARVNFALERGEHPQAAVESALRSLVRVGGDAGLIAIDMQGRIGWKHTGTQFAVGWASRQDPDLQVVLANMEEAHEND